MRKNSGFTLVELMVTLAVLAIVVSLALPSMRSFVRQSNAATTSNNILTAFTLARSEAIRSNGNVSVCPSNTDQTACAASWNNGWIVFTDAGVAGVLNPGTDVVISTFAAAPTGTVFSREINVATFNATGMRRAIGDPTLMPRCIEYKIDNNDDSHRYILLGRTGTARLGKGACT